MVIFIPSIILSPSRRKSAGRAGTFSWQIQFHRKWLVPANARLVDLAVYRPWNRQIHENCGRDNNDSFPIERNAAGINRLTRQGENVRMVNARSRVSARRSVRDFILPPRSSSMYDSLPAGSGADMQIFVLNSMPGEETAGAAWQRDLNLV